MIRLRVLSALLLLASLAFAPLSAAAAERLRIASWHIPDLWHEAGKALRVSEDQHSPARRAEDFEALKRAGEDLDADVIALQSIGSPQAARRVLSARDYHLVFSKQLAKRALSYKRALSDPKRRAGYTAIAVRRERDLRVQRVIDVPELALAGGETMPAGLAAELRVGGETVWLLAVDLVVSCGEEAGACPTLDAQVEVLGRWVDDKLGEGANYVIAGTLNRGVGARDGSGTVEPLWDRLEGAAALPAHEETIVVLGEGPAPEEEAAAEAWSQKPWKTAKRSKHAKTRGAEEEPPDLGSDQGLGVGRMKHREGDGPKAPPPSSPWEIVTTAFRELISSTREEQATKRAEEEAALAREKAAAYALAREAARSLGEEEYGVLAELIPPLPERKPDPNALPEGVPRLAIGARLARFPDGAGRNPCHAGGGDGPPLDYILLDRRLTEQNGLAGFGALPLAAGEEHCPVYVDLRM